MKFEFELGQAVVVDGVRCLVTDREIFEDKPDYLLRPLDSFRGFTKSGHELPGWIRPENIEKSE